MFGIVFEGSLRDCCLAFLVIEWLDPMFGNGG